MMNKRFLNNIENVRSSECDGKEKHSADQAMRIARHRKGYRAYRCRTCGEWHVANSTARGLPKLR